MQTIRQYNIIKFLAIVEDQIFKNEKVEKSIQAYEISYQQPHNE